VAGFTGGSVPVWYRLRQRIYLFFTLEVATRRLDRTRAARPARSVTGRGGLTRFRLTCEVMSQRVIRRLQSIDDQPAVSEQGTFLRSPGHEAS